MEYLAVFLRSFIYERIQKRSGSQKKSLYILNRSI